MLTSAAPSSIQTLWLSIVEFTQKSTVSRLSPEVVQAARHSLAHEQKTLSERADPLAVWYAEIDAEEELNAGTLEALIEANLRVGVGSNVRQYDGAWCSMELAQEKGTWLKSQWFQSLGRWDDAVTAVKKEGLQDFDSMRTLLGCQHELTDFPAVLGIARGRFPTLSREQQADVAHWCTVASWAEGDFAAMGNFISCQPKGSTRLLYK